MTPYLIHLVVPSPQYYEIYLHGEVVGISILFIAIDCLGGVFSVLSLVFKEEFDVIAGVTYSLVIVRAYSDSERCCMSAEPLHNRY